METHVKQIVDNTNPKSSFHILLSDKKSDIKTKFTSQLVLDETKEFEMALVNLETYYSFPNIDRTNNNFRYSPDNGKSWFNIDIAEGCYELEDIDDYIQRIMKINRHYDLANEKPYIKLKVNRNTLRSILNLAEKYKVDFFTTPNSISSVLGFNKRVYSAGYNESENIVNIININSLRVTCDIIGSSFSNGSAEPIIYSFFSRCWTRI